jgi:hypothetical protein
MAHARFASSRINPKHWPEHSPQALGRPRLPQPATICDMAKGKRDLVEVRCPCCEATLQIDPELKAVISYSEHKKPPAIEDIGAAVQKLKGEEARRDEVFQKSFAQHKSHQQVLDRKFDELLKQAKENPDAPPPKKPFDFD